MYLYVGSSSRVHSTIGTTAQASPASGLAHHPQQQTYTDEELSEFIWYYSGADLGGGVNWGASHPPLGVQCP